MPIDTVTYYDANAAEYVLMKRKPEARLLAFLTRCRAGGKILELGTGGGADAAAMIEAGFHLDATDGSRELADIASRRIGRPVRTLLFNELDAQRTYDGVYACASLTHAPRAELGDIIARVYRALKENGIAWASFKIGSEEGEDAFGRYYNYLSQDELISIWQKSAPWSTLESESWQGSGYDRKPTSWMAITAVR